MDQSETTQTLDELLRILCRSLPAYLNDARPWTNSSSEPFGEILNRIVADQQHYARRLYDEILAQGGRPDFGLFDASFPAKNDLSLEYLRAELIERQRQNVAAIENCAARLENNSTLHSLAEEILGNARGHLDILLSSKCTSTHTPISTNPTSTPIAAK